jgi:hypothetical protein
MSTLLFGIAIGLVIKVLVPMPWFDDPVRRGWAWLGSKIAF